MLTISKPLSSSQAQAYHKEEFANARDNYYTEGERVRGEWHGQLAARWGLQGEVQEEYFQRLANGEHPISGEARSEERRVGKERTSRQAQAYQKEKEANARDKQNNTREEMQRKG